jgi:hypothetical protein
MKVMLVGICVAALMAPPAWGAVGGKPRDESLQDLYNEYVAYTEGTAVLTQMGLPIGMFAPPIEGVSLSDVNTVIVFMYHTILKEVSSRLESLFQLLAEWDEIPGVQVVSVMSYVGDPEVLVSLHDIAPCTLAVDDRMDVTREAYNLRNTAGPGLAFYFLDTRGRIAYRWLGLPIFGNAWADFLRVPCHLAENNAVPAGAIMQYHPDNTLGALADTFEFTDLAGDHVHLPALGRPAFVYFMLGVSGVEMNSSSRVVSGLARAFSDHISFYAIIPDVTAEGLLLNQEVADRGLIADAVAQEAEDLLGPLPSTVEEIKVWLDDLWTGVTLPPMLKAQDVLGIPVLRDADSQAQFGWGVSLYGYRTFLVLDEDGHILAFGPLETAFAPLYAQWLEEMRGDSEW